MAARIVLEFDTPDNIKDAFEDAIRIANTLGVFVQFDFNGVTCYADKNSSAEQGVTSYHNALACNHNTASA
jgi:hypothetical protein